MPYVFRRIKFCKLDQLLLIKAQKEFYKSRHDMPKSKLEPISPNQLFNSSTCLSKNPQNCHCDKDGNF